MLAVAFTLDYEIYGNGKGSLRELVLDPTERLADLFRQFNAPLVIFVEALEFAKMEECQSDDAIGEVAAQLRRLRSQGHEIALHLHPQWANARFDRHGWRLDFAEYNLCVLPPQRIACIVDHALAWLRRALGSSDFTPVSFRAGNWLFRPTRFAAKALASRGVRADSSVFKGGRIRSLGLDYRPALRNGSWWRFSSDVNVPDDNGLLVELPIYTEMVPFWKMLKPKRLRIQKKVPSSDHGGPLEHRWADFMRLRYPRKFDFCRMTAPEMCAVVERAVRSVRPDSRGLEPVIAIGHSKDLVDLSSIRVLLDWLRAHSIPVTTLAAMVGELAGVTQRATENAAADSRVRPTRTPAKC